MTDRCKNITLATTSLRPVKTGYALYSAVWKEEVQMYHSTDDASRVFAGRVCTLVISASKNNHTVFFRC